MSPNQKSDGQSPGILRKLFLLVLTPFVCSVGAHIFAAALDGSYEAPIGEVSGTSTERFKKAAERLVAKTKHNLMKTHSKNYAPPLPLMEKFLDLNRTDEGIIQAQIFFRYAHETAITKEGYSQRTPLMFAAQCDYPSGDYGYLSKYTSVRYSKVATDSGDKEISFSLKQPDLRNKARVDVFVRAEDLKQIDTFYLYDDDKSVFLQNMQTLCGQLRPVVDEVIEQKGMNAFRGLHEVSTKYATLGNSVIAQGGVPLVLIPPPAQNSVLQAPRPN